MKTRILIALCAGILPAAAASAAMINEFEPNPAGTDPSPQTIELKGTPGTSFTGALTYIDTDPGGAFGVVNNSFPVSGTFDSNGLLTASIDDPENPSFLVVLSADGPAAGIDLDSDDDLVLDISGFVGVEDAIGIIDSLGDASGAAAQFGGSEFAVANEFEIAFRDGATDDWYGVDTFSGEVFNLAGTDVGAANFDIDPLATTLGAVNPTLVPEPGTVALALLSLASFGAVSMRSRLG